MEIGPYALVDELGRGATSLVYKARAPDGRLVAVKVLLRGSSPEGTQRFDRERRLLAELGEEAGFVPYLDSGTSPRGPFLVMPLVGGGTLRARLDRGDHRLPIADALALGRSLARALAEAHRRGVVHRDLKPENVLFTAEGRPLIADMGLAKHFRRDAASALSSDLSKTGDLRGTPGYCAPEQLRDSKDAGPPADVFSLGAILYECLAGVPPFGGATILEVLARSESGEKEPLARVRPDVPAWLAAVVDRALEAAPERRFADAAALLRALEAPPARRSRAAPVAVVLAIGATVAAWTTSSSRSRPPEEPSARHPRGSRAVAPPETASVASATAPPAWYLALPADERPALPEGITCTETAGDYRNAKDRSILRFVPGGVSVMGTPGTEMASPPHEVELSPYFIGKHETTVAQFERFVAETGYVTEVERTHSGNVRLEKGWSRRAGATWRAPFADGERPGADLPVTQVSWNDALAYVRWAGLDLPTEAQWEKAALWDPKTKTSHAWAWGDDGPAFMNGPVGNLPDLAARREHPSWEVWDGYDDGYVRPSPVGKFPRGASFYGLLDVVGNVNEWCLDGYDAKFYAVSPRRDPVRAREGCRTVTWRGSCWAKWYPCTGYFRGFREPDAGSDALGFRVARPAR